MSMDYGPWLAKIGEHTWEFESSILLCSIVHYTFRRGNCCELGIVVIKLQAEPNYGTPLHTQKDVPLSPYIITCPNHVRFLSWFYCEDTFSDWEEKLINAEVTRLANMSVLLRLSSSTANWTKVKLCFFFSIIKAS